MSKWIKCSERLPEPGKAILLHTTFGGWVGVVCEAGDGRVTFVAQTMPIDPQYWKAWMPYTPPADQEDTTHE